MLKRKGYLFRWGLICLYAIVLGTGVSCTDSPPDTVPEQTPDIAIQVVDDNAQTTTIDDEIDFVNADGLLPLIQDVNVLMGVLQDRNVPEQSIDVGRKRLIEVGRPRQTQAFQWIEPQNDLSFSAYYVNDTLQSLSLGYAEDRYTVKDIFEELNQPDIVAIGFDAGIDDCDVVVNEEGIEEDCPRNPLWGYVIFYHQYDDYIIEHDYSLGRCDWAHAQILDDDNAVALIYDLTSNDAVSVHEGIYGTEIPVWSWDEIGNFENLLNMVSEQIEAYC